MAKRVIRKLDDGSSGGRLREGDRIEADYRGRGKFYPGKITRDRGDDTYDIDYDDGERETRVAKRLIRSKDGGGGDDKLRSEGDLVEARYRGREKYYKGKFRATAATAPTISPTTTARGDARRGAIDPGRAGARRGRGRAAPTIV